jgi:hypothetical protein
MTGLLRAGSEPEGIRPEPGSPPSRRRRGTNAYHEFLDHIELGLAMETLADLGERRGASESFWDALSYAARNWGWRRKPAGTPTGRNWARPLTILNPGAIVDATT